MEAINQNDYLMLLALEGDPVMSMRSLAKKTKLSWTTVRKRYNNIVLRGIVRPPLAKIKSEKLGLKRISFNTKIPNFKSLIQVEKILNEHPYIMYRSRSIGENIGVFTQFDIPANKTAEINLIQFFNELKNMNSIADYTVYPSMAIRNEIFPDLTKFDINTASWRYSWDNWFDELNAKDGGELPLPIPYETDFSNFTSQHFNIIHELSMDGTVRQADLVKKYNLSKTEAHRQYNYVMENYIKNLRLNYNRDYFDLTETYIFILSSISLKDQAILFSQLKNNPPPFRFAIDILEELKVMIWGNMSAAQSNSFIIQLWSKYPDISISRLNTRDDGSMSFYFWPPNFDFENKQWKVDEDYMVLEPLKVHG